jgi:hypothetical protein
MVEKHASLQRDKSKLHAAATLNSAALAVNCLPGKAGQNALTDAAEGCRNAVGSSRRCHSTEALLVLI